MFLVLIGIGFLQFLSISSVITNVLLLIAFGFGIFGLYLRYQKV